MTHLQLQIAVASAYPPHQRPLSEYVWHVVESLKKSPRIRHVHVLADDGSDPSSLNDDKVTVHRCWTFGGVDQPLSVARVARKLKVDAVWFHLHMTSGGNTRLSCLAGLAAPAFCRSVGLPTVVTLHNMLGLTDLRWARPTANRLDVIGAHVATQLLRVADQVCVPLPEYVDLLRSRYRIHARFIPLGTIGIPLVTPPINAQASRSLLVFGHFGSYKRLEPVIDAVRELAAEGIDVNLIVAGADSRQTPGYLASLQQQFGKEQNVRFVGYVPERDVPSLFRSAAACILPYVTVAGMSSVAIQAAMYCIPLVAADTPGIRSFERAGLRMNFFEWPSTVGLKKLIRLMLTSTDSQHVEDVRHNLEYCKRQMLDDVVDEYIDVIESSVSPRSRG